MLGACTQLPNHLTAAFRSKGPVSPVRTGGRDGRLAAVPHPGRQRGQAGQHTVPGRRRTMLSAVDPDELGISRTEELRDGSIMFRFGDDAETGTSSDAAVDAAPAAGNSDEAAKEAASADQEEVWTMADFIPADADSRITSGATEQQAAHAAAVAEVSSSDDDPHTEEADAGGSQTHSIDRAHLQDLKVAELKELARENDLRGYSALRKNELVDFLAEALPDDYQI